jgi:hypothetical protein
MVNLQLSDVEARDLRTSLSIRLVGMREELVHTDNREYRDDLRENLDRLEGVLARLDKLLPPVNRAA